MQFVKGIVGGFIICIIVIYFRQPIEKFNIRPKVLNIMTEMLTSHHCTHLFLPNNPGLSGVATYSPSIRTLVGDIPALLSLLVSVEEMENISINHPIGV